MPAVLHPAQVYKDISEKVKYRIFTSFSLVLGILSLFFNSPQEIWKGSWTILTSPANLLTDYMEVANIGATLLNASIMTLEALWITRRCKAKLNGPVIAGILTITGFSFFGKNLYNSLPIIIGALGYAKITRHPLERSLLAALFGTALSPLVSELSFNQGLSLPVGMGLGMVAGFLSGFAIPPLASHLITFTKGFSLYNVGFTCGIIGTLFISLMRNFGMTVENVSYLSSGNNLPFTIILTAIFSAFSLMGLYINHWTLHGLPRILRHSGQLSTDYVELGGFGATLINMGFLGIFSVGYVLLLGGELNGPVIGGIFTVVGFGAFGKNLKNAIPIMFGVTLMSLFTYYDTDSTSIIIAILFGTTLAPIAGRYGPLIGMLAGALHLTLVMNIGFLHAGVNLYNNGFSGGLVAGILVPILEAIHFHWAAAKELRTPVDPAEEVEIRD